MLAWLQERKTNATGLRAMTRRVVYRAGTRHDRDRKVNSLGRDDESVFGSRGQGGEAGDEEAGDGVLHFDGFD